jgi:aryl-alcohol dehydrogenase-like predicted oxidoreductase
MEYTRLGTTGLQVSRICLGMMSFGDPARGGHPWSLPEEASRAVIEKALGAGITFFDTANVYSAGSSEEITGRALKDFADREDVVLATKVHGRMRPGPNGAGLSRKAVLAELEASLERLGTDYVDLWQVHAFDPYTPLDETLQALDIAVASGRARYVGVSNFCGWQLAKAATWQLASPGVRTRLASTQMEYSLLQRGVEREVLPAALDLGVGLLPSSPLGRGVLTGKYRHATPAAPFVEPYLDEAASSIVDAVTTAADGLAATALQVALAWVRDRPGVVAPIVGARNAQQLTAALSVEALSLPDEICQALDDVSAPVHRYPDQDWSTL